MGDALLDCGMCRAFVLLLASVWCCTAVPVYVMLPLDTVTLDGNLKNVQDLNNTFLRLKSADVDGVMVDVWWGVVEKSLPMAYNWNAYEQLMQMAQDTRLKVQVVMSFHQCGGNVGDSCSIPLPDWVLAAGKNNSNIFYTDAEGVKDYEYISLGVDNVEVLNGRSPITVYSDFMESFARTFADYMGTTLVEIQVGMGPAGELRYPSYPSNRWQFPGIGEFQCYDRYMLNQLKSDATSFGHPEWGNAGPADAGHYNDVPSNSGFFRDGGSYNTDYGRFFLNWYSNQLIGHGDRVLQAASQAFGRYPVQIVGKIAGIHWWYNTASHAAELTAGYYNIYGRDGYSAILSMFAKHHVNLDFTMLEMTDNDNPQAQSRPEELIKSVFADAVAAGIGLHYFC
eukprot:c576_g1_i2.p1 GENE.c576_g1_i2~~c576_g1_i2.p1  ORF type:complete len:396 (-),score=77.15 c576_g1_i2:313-1500(-)